MIKSLAAAVAVAVVSMGCTGSTTQSFDAVFEFHAATAPQGGCTTVTDTLDLTTVGGFNSVKSRVQEVTVNGLSVTVVNPKLQNESLATQVQGEVSVGDSAASEVRLLGTYTPLQLAAGNTQELDVESAGVQRFNDLATTSPYTLSVSATGCADQFPAHFSLEAEITATVKFKAL